ncbi:hypothetical protein FDUTEX481_07558 [Tolypothrix sp. PCC 7601]|nr:hypothetical protein FDUTEX481_07558 [Tolypothrix sp. PCC 7601]
MVRYSGNSQIIFLQLISLIALQSASVLPSGKSRKIQLFFTYLLE